jgi:CheY-like chemotaxis protein
MASGVAHDFNNVLAKILGFSELVIGGARNLDDKSKKYLQMINGTALEAVEIVNRLREFYRPRQETEVYGAVDLNDLAQQAIRLTEPKWKNHTLAHGATIRIHTELATVPFAQGHASELREVVTNLILNAVDALPAGGTITVRTRSGPAHVELAIADTGTGMTEEVRQQCLEPFFTTKGDDTTGLGLPIVYGIVKRHGGALEIQSEPGRGTTITVRLPIHAEQQAPDKITAHPLRVLLVEDEPLIGDIEAEYLRQAGHTVVTAGNGRDGVDKFRADKFDLVVTDRAMPEMSGDQLTETIRRLAPQTPIIMVTGYRDQRKDDQPGGANLVLGKPITQAALHQAVLQVTAPAT